MTSPEEIFDIVDDQDRVIGQAPRAEVHARNFKHRAVHVLLFNSRGELLVQKRSPGKDTFPGCYDSSASGHLASGEDYDTCAVRELFEELGLDLPSAALQKCFQIAACPETGWEFVWVYAIRGDYPTVINSDEITSADYWPLASIRTLMAAQPDLWARPFVRVLEEMEHRGLLTVAV